MMHRSPITVVTGVAGGGFADADAPESYRLRGVGDAEARGRQRTIAAHTAKTRSSLTRERPTRLSRRSDRFAERSRWLASQARAPNVATATTKNSHGGTWTPGTAAA